MSEWQMPTAATLTSTSPDLISSRLSDSGTRAAPGALATHARITADASLTAGRVLRRRRLQRYRARRAFAHDRGHLAEQVVRHLRREHAGYAFVVDLEQRGQQRVALGV